MDSAVIVSLPLELDGAAFSAARNKPSASPSPGALSASVVTTASPYPPPPSSASSMQMISSETPLGREAKRPRIVSRQSGAISGNSTDMGNTAEQQSMDSANEHLGMTYSQGSEIGSQPSSSIGLVTPSTIPNDTYPAVGTSYWSGNFLGAGTMDKSTSENGDETSGLRGEGQVPGGGSSQMYGSGVAWGSQDMSMSINTMQQYVPRRMANSSWESEAPHNQQGQQAHQQMQPDGSLASPYDSPSTANNRQPFGDYSMVNGPAHRIVPSNAYGTPGGSSAATTPGAAGAWPQSAFYGPGSSKGSGSVATMGNPRAPANMRGGRLGSTGLAKDIKPKILASAASSLPKKSPIQQSATTRSERAKTGDRTTHNDVERKYRTNLKDRIAELRAAVPALQAQQDGESDGTASHAAPKVSKGTVLSKATEYIQQLEQANRAMMSEHQQLVERLQTLEAMLQTGGGRPPQFTPNHGLTLFDPRAFS
ncbi:hypothetical protein NLG97_g6813 [Lecanicillium saksenae]|uniref:Uncharacterized protein n=1 Tax=Lecanicillium saksenae TaxID=468837 RepID=A0ACC1QNK4_9HYPO|nr:hypothetical protein NLG97_g6813 [Lecanicillium saksenae]